MKKFSAVVCVILVAISLSACRTFYDTTTENYPQENPLETTIFLQFKNLGADPVAELSNWLNIVRTENEAITDETAVKIISIEPRDDGTLTDTYTFDLKLQNVPDSTLRKQVRPFKITYTQTIFNPITLLPDSDVFTYIVAYNATKRHSAANAKQIMIDEDGNYVYLWTTNTEIQFVDVYPNRPLYYLFIVIGAAILGTVVYLVSRYYDCKKRKNQL